jgi:hypothetical protein
MGKSVTARGRARSRHDHCDHAPRSVRDPADRPRGAADDPPRRIDRAEFRPGTRLCRATSPYCRPRCRRFLRFCQLNPTPCPLLAASGAGDWRLPSLAEDLDIRTDLARYRVFRNGELIDEPADVRTHWRDDLVTFALGCSFSFEEALVESGIELRHITCGTTVPMYCTSIATAPAGPFHGPMVVSMRPLKPADAIRAIQITTRFPVCTARRYIPASPS